MTASSQFQILVAHGDPILDDLFQESLEVGSHSGDWHVSFLKKDESIAEKIASSKASGEPFDLVFYVPSPYQRDFHKQSLRLREDISQNGVLVIILESVSDLPAEEYQNGIFFLEKPIRKHEIQKLAHTFLMKWYLETANITVHGEESDGEDRVKTHAIPVLETETYKPENILRAVVDNLPHMAYWKSRNSTCLGANEAMVRFLGLKQLKAMVGKQDHELPWPNQKLGELFRYAGRRVMESGVPEFHVVETFPISANRKRMLDASHIPLLDSRKRVIGVLSILEDVTRSVHEQPHAVSQALHDADTGLSTRALLFNRISHAVQRVIRDKDHLFSVLCLGLDRFGMVNQRLGNQAGDQLLKKVGLRLARCLRPTDTIARLEGDQFGMLLDEIRNVSDATRVAQRLQEHLKEPFHINGEEIFVSASIGIAPSITGYDSFEAILRDSKSAMKGAKKSGTGQSRIFEKTLHIQALRRLELEQQMRGALQNGEFFTVFQPIVDLASGRPIGFEVLARWRQKERGQIFPDEFIPVAEETGMIIELGRQILFAACRQMHQWRLKWGEDFPFTVSVNLSPKQFADPMLVQDIFDILLKTEFPAERLKLEITEGVLIENVENVSKMVQTLKKHRIALLIDDFGTGYSSLSYLHRFPMDILKIDRSFIANMTENKSNLEIVRTIVNLAHGLNMEIIAEGIETREHVEILQSIGCEYGQGYYFSKPLPAEEAEILMESHFDVSHKPRT